MLVVLWCIQTANERDVSDKNASGYSELETHVDMLIKRPVELCITKNLIFMLKMVEINPDEHCIQGARTHKVH